MIKNKREVVVYKLFNKPLIICLMDSRYLRTLEKQTKIDKQEVAAMIEDRKRFLHHAVRCYASCLQRGDTHDLRIFRLTSLWFDNSSSPEVNQALEVG